MKRSTRSFEIADPFYAALETMSRELEVDRDTLVNQAIFALARSFGFVTPSTVMLNDVAGAAVVPPPAAVTQAVVSTPAPSAEAAAPLGAPANATAAMASPAATAMGPSPTAAPAASAKPKVDLAAARATEAARMAEIAKDMDALAAAAAKHAMSQQADDEEGEEDLPQDEDQADPEDSLPGARRVESEDEEDAVPKSDSRDLDSTSDEHTPERDQNDDDEENTDSNARRAAGRDQEDEEDEGAPAETSVHHAESKPEQPIDRTVLVRPSATLKVWVSAADGNEVQVEPGRFVIGRGDNCNLVIDSLRVSREHASIQIVGNEVIVEDLGSSNGTWFNGEKIDRRLVSDGDEVVLGNERVRFHIES